MKLTIHLVIVIVVGSVGCFVHLSSAWLSVSPVDLVTVVYNKNIENNTDNLHRNICGFLFPKNWNVLVGVFAH